MLNPTSYQLFGKQNISEPLAMTIGNFDGVHAGHCYLINELKRLNPQTPVAVVTFDPHPETFFHPQNPKPLLTSLNEKVRILLKSGVDVVIVQKFSKDFSSLTADDFCFWLKKNFKIQTLMLGHDFCYGKGRKGNFEHMQNFVKHEGWNLKQAPAYKVLSDKIVSSSFIREVLARGEVETVEKLLTRPYFLSGTVVRGDGCGSKLGYHTANICLDENLVIPKYGVYACYVEIDKRTLLPAVMNCGVRPTIPGESKLQIEAHILNFSTDIYDKKVKFHLKKFLREEMKFNNLEQLKLQIEQDTLTTKNYFLSILRACSQFGSVKSRTRPNE